MGRKLLGVGHCGHIRTEELAKNELSMTEGETVQNSVKLSRIRIFGVSNEVEPSGRITMLAHLKISEGGGPLAPRVYF